MQRLSTSASLTGSCRRGIFGKASPTPPTTIYGRSNYSNPVTEFFFTHWNRGFESPLFAMVFLAFNGAVTYRVYEKYFTVEKIKEKRGEHAKAPRVPFADDHNAFFNFPPAESYENSAGVLAGLEEEESSAPGLIAIEDSERSQADDANSVLVMEVQELEPDVKDDVFYRTVHYVGKAATAKGTKGSTAPGEAARQSREEQKAAHIHANVKCRMVTSENQCVPWTGNLMSEVHRKMVVAFGPLMTLQDQWDLIIPRRFVMSKQPTQRALVLGLRGGEMPRFITTAFPWFECDVVEPDGALVRLSRQFLGFRESDNLTVYVNPMEEFVRVAKGKARRYEAVFVDAVNECGAIPRSVARLEFIESIRTILADNGLLVVNLPNNNGREFEAMVDSFRMGFNQQHVVLLHCSTSRNSVLIAANDSGGMGSEKLGGIPDAGTLKEMLHTRLTQFKRNIDFKVSDEVTDASFQLLEPGKRYSFRFPNADQQTEATAEKKKPRKSLLGLW